MKLIFLMIIGSLLSTPITSAILVENPNTTMIPVIGDGNVTVGLAEIIAFGIALSSILGVIAIIWGGILMIYSAGSDETFKKGRWTMIYGVVGTVLSAGAYALVRTVGNVSL